MAATARFQPIGPAQKGGPMQARISLRMRITNGTKQPMLLERVEIDGTVVSNFPAKENDLLPNESWSTSSNHASGHQVFALDMGISGWNGSVFDQIYPGTDGTQREHYRVYGEPLYAMASGTVCFALNDHSEKAFIGDGAPTGSPTFGGFFGGGNSLFVNTGEEIAFYAHLQPGSIPPELMAVGAPVTRGQYIGKVGYSGSTSHPHVHINVKKEPAGGAPNGNFSNANGCDSGFFRPMQFGDIQSLTMHGGNQHWIGVFRQGNDGHAFFSVTTYAAFLQAVEVNNGLGLRLVDVHVEQ